MKLTPEELNGNGFVLLDKMPHNELVPFVKKYIHQRTVFSAAYFGLLVISFCVLVFFCIKYHRTDRLPAGLALAAAARGIALAFLLIPLHEFIHVIAYRLMGARQTSYDVHLKKFYFLALAHRFVASKKEFIIVALAPVVVISFALLIVSFFTSHTLTITLLATITAHASCCTGDFALLSYFNAHRHLDIVTYDDGDEKISYFYGRAPLS